MAIVVSMHAHGMTVDQYRALGQRINDEFTDGPTGALSHLCFGRDGDLNIVDVWEDEAACRKFMAAVEPIAKELGIELRDLHP